MPKRCGSNPMLAIQSETRRAYCLVVRHRPGPRRPANRNSPGFLPADPYVVVDRLAGLLGQFEPDRLPGLLLPHRRPIDRIPVRCNVLDLERDDIAAAQLAVDGEIEHRQVAHPPVDLELGADRPNVLRPQRRLRANQLALVPGRPSQRFGMGVLMICPWSFSSVGEDDQHGAFGSRDAQKISASGANVSC